MSASKSNVQDKLINKEMDKEMHKDIDPDVSFVSRWSRLKHENKQTDDTVVVDAIVDTVDDKAAKQTIASDEEQQAPAKTLTDADMPDIESMTADSDYTDFLSPGVSEELRRLALRKLFRSEVFNIRDGLDEYDGDYTHFEKLGDIVTSDMKHQLEMEAKRKAEQALQDENSMSEENVDDRADNRAVEDGISEMDIDSDSDDCADNNKIAANQQDMSQSSHDDAQTLTDMDMTAKQAVTEQAASAEKNTKQPDENAGFADTTINNTDQNKG